MLLLLQKVFSCCLKDVYIVNLPSFGKAVLAMVKKIIKPKLFERVRLLNKCELLLNNLFEDSYLFGY
jgi:hypothetical protein